MLPFILVGLVTLIIQGLCILKRRENFVSEPPEKSEVDLGYSFSGGSPGHFRLGTFLMQWGIHNFKSGTIYFPMPFTQFFGMQCARMNGNPLNPSEHNIKPQMIHNSHVDMYSGGAETPYFWIAYGMKM